jgi:hypothetical protein
LHAPETSATTKENSAPFATNSTPPSAVKPRLKPQVVDCAKLLDISSNVRHWVRNVPRTPNSFALPGRSQPHYYPDFVVQLTDDRVVVIEYKGEHLYTADKAKELRDIGQRWAAKSAGKAVFLMPTKNTLDSDLASVDIVRK